MTRTEFLNVCRNAKNIDMLIGCRNADFEIDDKAYKVASGILESDELNDVLNEKDAKFVLQRADGFQVFIPDTNWDSEKEVIEVGE